jgi:hypothetical protein
MAEPWIELLSIFTDIAVAVILGITFVAIRQQTVEQRKLVHDLNEVQTNQIKEQTTFRRLIAYNHLYEIVVREESRYARYLIYEANRKGIFKNIQEIRADEKLLDAIGTVTSDYDHIGKLIETRDIEPDFAYELYGASAYAMYAILKDYLAISKVERNKELPWDFEHFEYFRKLAEKSEEWLNNKFGRVR